MHVYPTSYVSVEEGKGRGGGVEISRRKCFVLPLLSQRRPELEAGVRWLQREREVRPGPGGRGGGAHHAGPERVLPERVRSKPMGLPMGLGPSWLVGAVKLVRSGGDAESTCCVCFATAMMPKTIQRPASFPDSLFGGQKNLYLPPYFLFSALE